MHPIMKRTMERVELKTPAVPAEPQVRELELKGCPFLQVHEEELTLSPAFHMLSQSTWQV